MNLEQMSLLVLIELEEELSERLDKLTDDLSKSHSPSFSEQASERENDDVISALEIETKSELQQVREAIKRIDEGTYRICVNCGDDIPEDRLSAIPYTDKCLRCADD